MKPHIVTIKLKVFAENDEDVVNKSNTICKKLHRESGLEPEVETIVESKKFSLFDRAVDYHRINYKIKQSENK